MIDSVSDAIFVHDAETGRILDVNRRMCEMYGLTRDEAIGAPADDLSLNQPPYSPAEALEWLRKAQDSDRRLSSGSASVKMGSSSASR